MNTIAADGSPKGARAFPAGFLWGVGTSAYQIEGATDEDGRGPSVWDTFARTPGKIRGGDTGDIACGSYHRLDQDLELLAGLGASAYRFSIAWPRIQPSGSGRPNQPGLDYYRALVHGLRERGIKPLVTLYHWDLPQALEDEGGWANRDTAQRFAEYAAIVATALGDAVALWTTVSEPQVIADQGYRLGTHAPGHADDALAAAATHHLLLAHGLALPALRTVLPAGTPVGLTLDLDPVRAADEEARSAAEIADVELNRIFLEPVLHGSYPALARPEMLPPDAIVQAGDMDLISAAIDFLGVNYYRPTYVRLTDWANLRGDELPLAGHPGIATYIPAGTSRTPMDWLIEPDGLYDQLKSLAAEAPSLTLYVTENGCAASDYINPGGEVNDFERVEYLYAHFDAAWRAIQDGVKLAGYFVWSLMDNFEWAWGYQQRFGLVYVDFATQRRLPKRSARFFAQVAAANALPPLETVITASDVAPDSPRLAAVGVPD
jgi:beta-glucosidase